MEEAKIAQVRSIYGEIKGYYKGLPRNSSGPFCVPSIIGQNYNLALDQLTSVIGISYSRFKIPTDELMRGNNCNIRVIEPQMSAVISKLEEEYGFGVLKKENSPNIVILNKNANDISLKIDYTFQQLIENEEGEAREKLKELEKELDNKNPNWENIKGILLWTLNFSKNLFLQILPLLLERKI